MPPSKRTTVTSVRHPRRPPNSAISPPKYSSLPAIRMAAVLCLLTPIALLAAWVTNSLLMISAAIVSSFLAVLALLFGSYQYQKASSGQRDLMVARAAAAALERGETVLAATFVVPPGATARRAIGSLFGPLGILAAEATISTKTETREMPMLTRAVVALTDRRILVFKPSRWSNEPKSLKAAVSFDRIREVAAYNGRLTLGFVDGTNFTVEPLRQWSEDTARFVVELQALVVGVSHPTVATLGTNELLGRRYDNGPPTA